MDYIKLKKKTQFEIYLQITPIILIIIIFS